METWSADLLPRTPLCFSEKGFHCSLFMGKECGVPEGFTGWFLLPLPWVLGSISVMGMGCLRFISPKPTRKGKKAGLIPLPCYFSLTGVVSAVWPSWESASGSFIQHFYVTLGAVCKCVCVCVSPPSPQLCSQSLFKVGIF